MNKWRLALLLCSSLLSFQILAGGVSPLITDADAGKGAECADSAGDPGPSGPSSPLPNPNAGNPINTISGGKFHVESLYQGIGDFPLEYKLYYNSRRKVNGKYQGVWSSSYSQRIMYNRSRFLRGDITTFIMRREDGQAVSFRDSSLFLKNTSQGIDSINKFSGSGLLKRVVDGTNEYFVYERKDGFVEYFDIYGRLTKIISPEGLAHTITRSIYSTKYSYVFDLAFVRDANPTANQFGYLSTSSACSTPQGNPSACYNWEVTAPGNYLATNLRDSNWACSFSYPAGEFFTIRSCTYKPPGAGFDLSVCADRGPYSYRNLDGAAGCFDSSANGNTGYIALTLKETITVKDAFGNSLVWVTTTYDKARTLGKVTLIKGQFSTSFDSRPLHEIGLEDSTVCEGCTSQLGFPGDSFLFSFTDEKMIETISGGTSFGKKTFLYKTDTSNCGNDWVCSTALVGIIDAENMRYATWDYKTNTNTFLNAYAYKGFHGTGSEKEDEFTINFDADDHFRTVTNGYGRKQKWNMQRSSDAVRINSIEGSGGTNCQANGMVYGYDASDRVNKITIASNQVLDYTYYDDGKVKSISQKNANNPNSLSLKTLYFWDTRFNRKLDRIEFYENGILYKIVEYDHYENGRILSRKVIDKTNLAQPYATFGREAETTYKYEYWSGNRVKKITIDGPRTDVTDTLVLSYNEQGLLTESRNALNQTIKYSNFTASGYPQTIEDEVGQTYSLKYNYYRNQITDIDVGTRSYRMEYYKNGLLKAAKIIGDGRTTAINYEYTSAYRLKSVTDSLGNKLSIENLDKTIDGNTLKTVTTTLKKNDLLEYQDEVILDSLGRLYKHDGIEYNYDALGNLLKAKGDGKIALGEQVLETYGIDDLGRPESITHLDAGKETYKQNAEGQVTKVTDPRGLVTTYLRDGFGRVIRTSSPDTGQTDYWYNSAGLVTDKIDSNGITTRYIYDVLGRVKDITYNGNYGIATEPVNYQYDYYEHGSSDGGSKGQLTVATKGAVKTTFNYSLLGELTGLITQIGLRNYALSYGYDNRGNLKSIIYPSGRKVNYGYFDNGNISSVTTEYAGAFQTLANNFAYKAFGPVTSFNYGAQSAKVDYRYDQRYRYTGQKNWETKSLWDYTASNYAMTNTLRNSANPASIADKSHFYIYAAGRLKSAGSVSNAEANKPDGPANAEYSWKESYTYDQSGNRTSKTLGTAAAQTFVMEPTNNRLKTVGSSAVFQYAAAGQMERNPVVNSTMIYDKSGRLREWSSGSTTAAYTYNALNERVVKTVANTTTHYIYQGTQLMAEVNADGRTLREYIYANGKLLALFNVDDRDGDNMDDEWEKIVFGNTSRDGQGDYDGDGIKDAIEFVGGTNANGLMDFEDEDNDGLPDAWERIYFGGLKETGSGDADKDGINDRTEILRGTNPVQNEAAWLIPILHMLLN